jgi:hypothetical protein
VQNPKCVLELWTKLWQFVPDFGKICCPAIYNFLVWFRNFHESIGSKLHNYHSKGKCIWSVCGYDLDSSCNSIACTHGNDQKARTKNWGYVDMSSLELLQLITRMRAALAEGIAQGLVKCEALHYHQGEIPHPCIYYLTDRSSCSARPHRLLAVTNLQSFYVFPYYLCFGRQNQNLRVILCHVHVI